MSSRPLPALILLVLAAFTVLSIAASSQSAAGFDVTAMAMYPQEVNGSYLIAVGAKVTTTFLFIFQKTCYYLDLYSYSDGTLTQLWNVSLSHEATAVALSPNLVAVGVSSGSSIFSSGSSSVEVFSTSGSGMWSVEYSYPTVTSLAISSADQVAVSVGGPSPEGAVYVYDESGDLLWNYSPSGYFGVHQLLFTPAGDLIVGAGNGYANGGWVIDFSQTGRVLWNVSTYDPTSLALGPNGVVVGAYVSYAFGGDNYVLEISDGRLLWVRDLGPNSRNTSLIWVSDSPNSALSAVAGNYGLHFVTGDGVYVLNYSLPFGDSEVAQSSNGSVVAVAELGGSQLLVFDYGEEIGSYSVGQIRSLAVNSQGNLIVVGTSNGLQAIQVTPSPSRRSRSCRNCRPSTSGTWSLSPTPPTTSPPQ
ncbi:hypothetical protein HS1genome_1728 [Sulfodiicoccus acidiphilus]|uniref:Pyrrolo-quinoline quinone repeat domain-containing protein n=1 Tax=Sulfodiicoccus acidiphilus TaxID=1670455 RepID=A0A348B587_9CREN|nr:PQQ-binding-like beta-propeller repeat protein [Sulfodiicoccus acidiphilus]BBD73339.1 hypothetical protein HS1genome_1728 [Sulfodiicoccus acidiphilus]